MKNSFKKSFMFIMLLLALTVSALGVTPALADDGVTPPADAPVVVEEPVADSPVVDAPVVAEETAVIEEPVTATEEEITTVAEVLDALPEGTDLVVVDSSGDALPLVSQEAAETLSSPSSDPFFWDGTQYVGYSWTGVCPAVVTVCNQSTTPLKAAITAFGNSSTATGSIYVEAGTYGGVLIDGSTGGANLKNLTGLIGAGSDTTTLNGDVTVQNMNMGTNVFTFQGFTLNGQFIAQNNTNTLNITDIVQVGPTGAAGILISNHTGNVTLTDVDAGGNTTSNGAYIGFVTGNVTVTTNGGTSTFNNNSTSIYVQYITGAITINDVAVTNTGQGFYNSGGNGSAAILNCDTFSGNVTSILTGGSANNTNTQTSNGCTGGAGTGGGTGGGKAYVPFPAVPVVPPVVPVTPPVVSPVTSQAVALPAGEDGKGRTTVQSTSLYTVLEQTQGQLPAGLEAGTFGSALKVALTDQGANVTDLVIKLSFPIPASMKDANLVVMFWDGSAWVEVSGGSVVGGSFVITVSQPGTYVLIAK